MMKFLLSLKIWIVIIVVSGMYKEGYNHMAILTNSVFFLSPIIPFLFVIDIAFLLLFKSNSKVIKAIDFIINLYLLTIIPLLCLMICFNLSKIEPPIHPEALDEMPCIGVIGSQDLKKTPKTGLKKWNDKCAVVVHFAHGTIDNDEHFVQINGKFLKSKNVSSVYDEKEQYWFACRKDQKDTSILSSFSFSLMSTNEPETIKLNDKNIHYYAKYNTYLVSITINPWVKWVY